MGANRQFSKISAPKHWSLGFNSPALRLYPWPREISGGEAVNELVRKGKRALRHAQSLLSVIDEEVTNRDNRTCLLLPPKNFGRDIRRVFECVRNASLTDDAREVFRKRLRSVTRSLRTERIGGREYFVGKGGLVFKSPGKAGARHGLTPDWRDPNHAPSCVRSPGRIRFGASYDPKFHYDCDIPGDGNRYFPSCHGTGSVSRNRAHVNIAPNDNIR